MVVKQAKQVHFCDSTQSFTTHVVQIEFKMKLKWNQNQFKANSKPIWSQNQWKSIKILIYPLIQNWEKIADFTWNLPENSSKIAKNWLKLRENQQNNPFLRENQLFFHHFLAKIAQNWDKIFNHFSRKSSKNMKKSNISVKLYHKKHP